MADHDECNACVELSGLDLSRKEPGPRCKARSIALPALCACGADVYKETAAKLRLAVSENAGVKCTVRVPPPLEI